MKKTIALLIALLMTVSLAACGGGKTNNTNTANTASDFKWTRTEYFANEDESVILSIFSLPEDEGPGWMAGFIAGDDIYSGNVSLKDNILKGNVAEDPQKDEYIITIAEEGEDGVLLTLPDGKSYSLKPYKFEEASIKVIDRKSVV